LPVRQPLSHYALPSLLLEKQVEKAFTGEELFIPIYIMQNGNKRLSLNLAAKDLLK